SRGLPVRRGRLVRSDASSRRRGYDIMGRMRPPPFSPEIRRALRIDVSAALLFAVFASLTTPFIGLILRRDLGATPLQLSVMSAAGGACLLLSLAWARAGPREDGGRRAGHRARARPGPALRARGLPRDLPRRGGARDGREPASAAPARPGGRGDGGGARRRPSPELDGGQARRRVPAA